MCKAAASAMLSLIFTGCGSIFDSTVDSVNLRVLNNSDYDFKNVTVNSVYFGEIKKYRTSEYKEFKSAYPYGAVRLEVNDKKFAWLPIDYLGATPLPKGKYTYMISIDYETNGTDFKFFKGDDIPQGRQVPGRSRIISIEHRYEAWSGREVSDGGYIISGGKRTITTINPTVSAVPGSRVIYLPDALTFDFRMQALLVKIDANGNKQWLQTYGENGRESRTAKAVEVTNDGGYVFAGYNNYLHTRPDGQQAWETNAWLVKVDNQGRQQWEKYFGDIDYTQANALQKTPGGGFIVAGQKALAAYLLKVDASGNEIWSKTFGTDIHAEHVQLTGDGGYIIVGDRYGYGSRGSRMTKTDALGNEVWSYHIDGAAVSVQQTFDGGYVVAGYGSPIDGLLPKVDGNGQKQWERRLGGDGKDWLQSVVQTPDSGMVLTGYTDSPPTLGWDYWLIKTDALGHLKWQQTFSYTDDDKAHAVIPAQDGGYLLIGTAGDKDIWLVKTNATGEKQWDRIIRD